MFYVSFVIINKKENSKKEKPEKHKK